MLLIACANMTNLLLARHGIPTGLPAQAAASTSIGPKAALGSTSPGSPYRLIVPTCFP